MPDETVAEVLSTADIGLSPDPKNPLNDLSTMNKTMEYMAFGLPVVAFDLIETRVSAGDAAVYVPDGDIAGYAQAVVRLLDDEAARTVMGAFGRTRVENDLGWPHQRQGYLAVFDTLLGRPPRPRRIIVLPKDDVLPTGPEAAEADAARRNREA